MRKHVAVLDLEVYVNYFLAAFKNVETGTVVTFEYPLDVPRIVKIINTYTLVTFNGLGYDIPMLMYALDGATPADLKKASNRIIEHNLKHWDFAREFKVQVAPQELDHVDLMEVAPLTGSLKLYGARMHTKILRSLPYEHRTVLTDEQKANVKTYCINDLAITEELLKTLKTQVELRESMSARYGIDLRSKSDAQIAEAVIKSEIEKLKQHKIERPGCTPGQKFKFAIQPWMNFFALDIMHDISQAEFQVNDKGKVLLPPQLAKRKIEIAGKAYKMGIGGLHSMEETLCVHADANHVLLDKDVTSYYPSILLNQGLHPKHLGKEFLAVYQALVAERLAAKKAGNKSVSESLKIAVNGGFGKFGSRWSILYSPDLMIQITVTGQIALLMLIEALDRPGVEVVSANTDGVFIRCERAQEALVQQIVAEWESETHFSTEEARYDALYARDVSNYIAVKEDGHGTKLKGVYGPGLLLHKNPVAPICAKAAIDYITLGASVEGTIRCCDDVREFVSIRNVKGVAVWRGEELGAVVRWYYATSIDEAILYKLNGYTVATTYGARPLMTLPDALPTDLNYAWYIAEANKILEEVGVV